MSILGHTDGDAYQRYRDAIMGVKTQSSDACRVRDRIGALDMAIRALAGHPADTIVDAAHRFYDFITNGPSTAKVPTTPAVPARMAKTKKVTKRKGKRT